MKDSFLSCLRRAPHAPPTTMEIVLMTTSGRLSGPIDEDSLRDLHAKYPDGTKLWKPGKLGTLVEDPDVDAIGSCHVGVDHEGVRTSGIIFRTGSFRLSFGRGLAELSFDSADTLRFVESCLREWTGCEVSSLRVDLMDARKRYTQRGQWIDPYRLAQCVHETNFAHTIHWPHRLSTGPLNRVRFFITGTSGPHVAIDHGGVAQFSGFKTGQDMHAIEECFDHIMDGFLKKHPPIESR